MLLVQCVCVGIIDTSLLHHICSFPSKSPVARHRCCILDAPNVPHFNAFDFSAYNNTLLQQCTLITTASTMTRATALQPLYVSKNNSYELKVVKILLKQRLIANMPLLMAKHIFRLWRRY